MHYKIINDKNKLAKQHCLDQHFIKTWGTSLKMTVQKIF